MTTLSRRSLSSLVEEDSPEVLRTALRDAFAAIQAQSLRITRAAELTLGLSGVLSPAAILDMLRQRLKWTIEFQYAILCHRRGDGSWQLNPIGGGDASRPALNPQGLLAATLRHGQPSIHKGAHLEGLEGSARSLMLIPLHAEGEVIGALACAHQAHVFDQDDLRIAAMVGLQLGSILRNAYNLETLRSLNERLDRANTDQVALLRNILPARVADELIAEGRSQPIFFEQATVLFTDFVGFTATSADCDPQTLVQSLDHMFSRFDLIIERNGIEKLKTIGDAYMAVGGVPERSSTHAEDTVQAALEIIDCVREEQLLGPVDRLTWDVRVGVHTGPLVAGVIGKRKFAFDVWGDTVNVASRLEEHGVNSRINISAETYAQVRHRFRCQSRGPIAVKGKGGIEMFLVEGPLDRLTTGS